MMKEDDLNLQYNGAYKKSLRIGWFTRIAKGGKIFCEFCELWGKWWFARKYITFIEIFDWFFI